MSAPSMRLRILFVTPEEHLLIIDKVSNPMDAQAVRDLLTATKTPALSGTLIFPGEVEIPELDDDANRIRVYPDEVSALFRVIHSHSTDPDVSALRLLADRAVEAATR